MPVRQGDATVVYEGKIEHKAPKSWIVEFTLLPGKWAVPFNQILTMSEPDGYGNVEFEISQWWWDRATPLEDDR